MRYFISFIISLLLSVAGFSQGYETFDKFDATGNSYQTGEFTGEDGFTWHYVRSRGDIEIDGKALTLGRDQSPAAELYSDSISGGVGVLEFQFMQAFSTNVNLEVYINEELVYTAATENEQNAIKDASVTVDVEGNIVLRFVNPSGAGQVAIDNISWTGYEEGDSEPEYCENAAFITEPITHVEFAGIDNPSPNDPNAPGYEDFTHIHASVETNNAYEITLQGSTEGPYTSYFTVWIDWNQDGIFDEDEMTQAGIIFDSTGDDDKTTQATIIVPDDAVLGTTRMRIAKNYGSPLADPCQSFTFGQIEDYSVDISEGDGGGGHTGDCYVKYNSAQIDGLGDIGEFILAADFPVEAGDVLDIYYLNFMLVGDVSGVELSVYEDSGDGPGAAILPPTMLTAISQTYIGESHVQSPLYDVRLDVSSLNLSLEGGEDGSKYWVAIYTIPGTYETNWWALSCDINNDTPFYGSLDEYGSWVNLVEYGFNTDGAFSINCPEDEEWDESCRYDCEDQVVPYQEAGSNLMIGGPLDNMLAFDIPVADNDFSFEGIEMNLYFQSGDGSDSPYEFSLYDDNEGEPGTVIDSWSVTGADESEHVSGNFYRVTVTFPAVDLEANTTYWLSVDSDAAAWQTIFFTALNKPVAYKNDNTEGEWVVQNSEDLIYELICTVETPSTPSDDCGPDYESELENGLGDLAGTVILASDFTVDPYISLNVNTVRIPLIGEVDSVEISFYEDEDGLPGVEVFAPVDVIPGNQKPVALNNFGEIIYEMELDMTPYELSLDGGADGAIYWMAITTVSDDENYWTYSTEINNDTYFAVSLDDYASWESTSGLGYPYDGAFSINCEGLPEIEVPSCILTIGTVEPITRVAIAADLSEPDSYILDNTTAPDSTEPIEDFTYVTIDFTKGISYEIGAEGNTNGAWTNYFTAFVDLSEGEWSDYLTFEIGSIENSTGTDGKIAVGSIELPETLADGNYPMRVIKNYGSSPQVPCGNYSFGQAEDYILTVTEVSDDFPEPYCDWEVTIDVEPITYVQFAGIDNETDPGVNGSPALENFTNIEGTVEQGGTYEIGVNGNTNGNYENYFAVYIDWNQDGDFDDPGEEYQIGTITNSDGTGGPILFDDIEVPEDALIGQTRMRVIKSYDPITDACTGAWWGQAEDYTLIVTEGNGGDDCWQGIPSVEDFGMAWRITLGQDFRVAEDFTVPEGTAFTVNQLTFDTNQVEVPNYAVINIREDNGEEPGAILHTIEMEPTSWEEIGFTLGDPIYKVVFDLEEPIEFAEGMYWIDPQMSIPNGGDVWWGGTNLHEDGLTPRSSSDNGATWTEFISLHMAFTISGHCETLGTADLSEFDFSYYPNPVRDVLHINSAKKLENVRVFNLTGQEINFNSKTGNGQIDVNALPTGVYVFRVMLEGGQVETFKIIKR